MDSVNIQLAGAHFNGRATDMPAYPWVKDFGTWRYYLPRAMQLQRDANPQVQFLVFSDDMERSKALPLLASCDVTFSAETNEVRTLVAMSRCWLGGICANSTFSWWGAYLNPNPARVVTFPSKWINADIEVDIQFEGSHILSVKKE